MNRSYRSALLHVHNQLTNQQLDQLKFLSRGIISNARMDRVRMGLDLFNALEERGRLSSDNMDFLHCLLSSTGCDEALRELHQFPSRGTPQLDREYLFRECLIQVGRELGSTELDQIKFQFKERLKQSTDRIFTATDLFQLFIQRQIVTPSNLMALNDVLCDLGRRDLSDIVNKYMMDAGLPQYQPHNHHDTPNTLFSQPDLKRPTQARYTQEFRTISSGVRADQSPDNSMPTIETLTISSLPSGIPSVNSQETLDSSLQQERGTPNSPQYVMVNNNGQVYHNVPPMRATSNPSMELGYDPRQPSLAQIKSEFSHTRPMYENISPYPVQTQPPQQPFHYPSQQLFHYPSQPEGDSQGFGPGLTFRQEESISQLTTNQQLQKELAQRDSELHQKELFIERYHIELEQTQAQISSVTSAHEGKEKNYQQRILELENVLQRMTSEAQLLRRDAQDLHQQLQPAIPRSTQDDEDFYRMNDSPHGLCLIINNEKFYHPDPAKQHPNRGGADVDVHNLKQTFAYLRYKVEVKENLSSVKMKQIMLQAANTDHSQYDSFVCCILTHGEEKVVHGSDCKPVNLNDLAGLMKMCPTLHGKPKMFFIQACRGEMESKGFPIERDAGGPFDNTIPQESDFYFGFATPTGRSAYRSRRYGSWFISELCQVLTKHAYTHDLGAMMVKVNKKVSDAYTKDGYKQSPESVNRLRFQVHFFRFIPSRVSAVQ